MIIAAEDELSDLEELVGLDAILSELEAVLGTLDVNVDNVEKVVKLGGSVEPVVEFKNSVVVANIDISWDPIE